MTRKQAEKVVYEIVPADVTASKERLREVLNYDFKDDLEGSQFLESMIVTGLSIWFMEERTTIQEQILTDTLAALMYVLI